MIPTVIITMGGLGKRFRDEGYSVPKYRILARGRSLFDWSLVSLQTFIDAGCRFVFVVQKGDNARDFIAERSKALGIADFATIEIDGLTDGQATTALLAGSAIDNKLAGIAIFNIDTHVEPSAMPLDAVRGDGWVPCFPASGEKWSFARAKDDGEITELREKKRISDHATLGLYYFRSFETYVSAYNTCFENGGGLEANERYIAPMYNVLIARGQKVYMHSVPAQSVLALGTPDDLRAFDRSANPENVA